MSRQPTDKSRDNAHRLYERLGFVASHEELKSFPGERSSTGGVCHHHEMVLEHALLSVRPGKEREFEDSFAQARSIIAGMPGFGRLTLSRCLERTSTYLLLVEWDHLEDHTVGFRGSPEYHRWRQMLHHFYDPFPVVEHYEEVLTA